MRLELRHSCGLYRGWDTSTVEFKSLSAGKLGDSLFETVSAFSNRCGGHILIGVGDDGAVIGVNAGLADTLGSGVRNLYKYTRIYSGQEPQLIDSDVFTTIIPLTRSSPPDVPTDVTTDVPTDVVRDGEEDLGESERRILVALHSLGSIPARQLASQTGLSDRQVKRILARLAEQGLIRREGSTRYGRWVVLE